MNKYIAFISTIVFLSLPLVASAQDIGDIKKTQAELQAQEKKKFETAKEKAAAEKKMKSVQADLVTAANKRKKIENNLNDLESQKQKLQQEQSYLTSRIIEDQGLSTTMLRSIYQGAKIPAYGLYFSKMPKDKILHRMIAMNTTIPSLHKRMQKLEDQVNEIKALQGNINKLIEREQSEQKNLSQSTKELTSLLSKRQKMYDTASGSYQKAVKNVERLQKEAKSLEDLVAQLRPSPKPQDVRQAGTAVAKPAPSPAPAVATNQDKTLPVAGIIKVNYGETGEIGGKNQGIVFTTQPNAVVVAPMAGKVVFAGPFQNFKQLLIIEHSGSYHSLIAGLDKIEANVGANLKTGEPIGRIDRSNSQKGRLYYELRKNSKPINPSSVFTIKNG